MRRLCPGFIAIFFLSAGAWAQTPDPATPAPAEPAAEPQKTLSPVPVVAKASLEKQSCFPGGEIVYHLDLAWSAPSDRRVLIKPFEPPQTQGLDLASRSQKSGKSVQGDQIETTLSTRAVYKCVTPGKYDLGPLTIPYEDGSGEQISTVAPAVPVEVRTGPLTAIRGTKYLKYVLFAAALAAFWIVVLLFRKRKKRKLAAADVVKEEGLLAADVWETLAEDAKRTPTGEFYARLEDALWRELFGPEQVISGTTSTRLAELAQAGLPPGVLEAAREAVNACQKARFTSGPKSQGDAVMIVRAARERVVEPLQSKRT